MKTLKLTSLAAALALTLACDGLFQVAQSVTVGQTPAGPTVPVVGCEVTSVVATGDAPTLVSGGSAVRLDATPYGQPAGTPLGDNCTSTLVPSWSQPSPCILEGGGYNPFIRAPAGTAAGRTCTIFATVGGRQSNQVAFTVQ